MPRSLVGRVVFRVLPSSPLLSLLAADCLATDAAIAAAENVNLRPACRHHHRSSALKQQNKKHKTAGTSKRSLDRAIRGRVEDRVNVKVADTAAATAAGRDARANRSKQIRAQKKAELAAERRSGTGTLAAMCDGCPQPVPCVHVD